MPQVLMLNHAAYINGERMKKRMNLPSTKGNTSLAPEATYHGKDISDLDDDELSGYFKYSFGQVR